MSGSVGGSALGLSYGIYGLPVASGCFAVRRSVLFRRRPGLQALVDCSVLDALLRAAHCALVGTGEFPVASQAVGTFSIADLPQNTGLLPAVPDVAGAWPGSLLAG